MGILSGDNRIIFGGEKMNKKQADAFAKKHPVRAIAILFIAKLIAYLSILFAMFCIVTLLAFLGWSCIYLWGVML